MSLKYFIGYYAQVTSCRWAGSKQKRNQTNQKTKIISLTLYSWKAVPITVVTKCSDPFTDRSNGT